MAAVATILRRSASSLSPYTFRHLSSRTIYQDSIHKALIFVQTSSPLAFFSSRNYSEIANREVTKRPSVDKQLLRVIESEIKAVKTDESPPRPTRRIPFQIEDIPGQQFVTLTRDYEGEQIKLTVSIPNVGDEEEENNDVSTIPIIATISKKGEPVLEFTLNAFPDELNIEALIVKKSEDSDDDLEYTGPEFGDLDEKLQDAFFKYLEIRGINAETTNFLFEYMLAKDDREYVSWLKKLQKFMEA